ncbi:MAG: hypothetical protein LBP59_12550 [Planctomycetaceae bacterium]|jgi:hypothetical protein|nr:hypothetical protein [Planctomycetaceae bacterium]
MKKTNYSSKLNAEVNLNIDVTANVNLDVNLGKGGGGGVSGYRYLPQLHLKKRSKL